MGKPKTALVLSGGAARGAFQAGALEHVLVEKRMKFDIVCGVSVGALNATMVAQGDFELLKKLWMDVRGPGDVYRRRRFWEPIAALTGASSFYKLTPLRKKIDRLVSVERIVAQGVELRIGVVALGSGKFISVSQTDPNFKDMLQASATIPVTFEPVRVSRDLRDLVDGGVRDQTPLGTAIELGAEEITVVLCSPREPEQERGPFDTILRVGLRTLDLILNETFVEDVRWFTWVNDILKDNPECGLKSRSGRPLRYIPITIIEPEVSPNNSLGFFPDRIRRAWKMGLEAARRVVP